MTKNTGDLDDVREMEITIFDQVIIAWREGRPIDVENLLNRLPAERREDLRQLLTTTHKLQTAAAAFKKQAAEDTNPEPTHLVGEDKK